MPLIQIELSDNVDARLRLEAAKVGMTKRKFVVWMLEKWASKPAE